MKNPLRFVLGSLEGGTPAWMYPTLVRQLFAVRATSVALSGIGAGIFGVTAAMRAGDFWVGFLAVCAAAAIGVAALVMRALQPKTIQSIEEAQATERRLAIALSIPFILIGLATARTLTATNDALAHLLMFSVAMAAMTNTVRNHPRPWIVKAQLVLLLSPILSAMLIRAEGTYWLVAAGSCLIASTTLIVSKSLFVSLRNGLVADEEIQTSNMRFVAALDNMAQGLAMFDAEGRLLVCNAKYLSMYRFSPEVVKPGITLQKLLEHSIAVGNHAGASVKGLATSYRERFVKNHPGVLHNSLADGRVIAIAHQPMTNGGWVTTHEDITQRKAAEARIAYLARHDALTGLPNRFVFREALEQLLERPRENIAVMCLDLDRFKAVNDTFGHGVGDRLLQAVASRLKGLIGETDVVARLGGDEFALIQTGGDQPTAATLLAERITDALAEPFTIEEQEINVGCSVGISVASEDGSDPTQLIRNSDLALYRAKSDGSGQHRFFSADMDERMQARRRLELDLRKALAAGEFELNYQPLVTVDSGIVSGFEALLRWRHPTRGTVMPDEFISLAEEIGLIVPIGEWVLREACATAATWPGAIRVAVNLSPVQFRVGNLLNSVVQALSGSGLAPHRLELEITEGVLLADNASTMQALHSLRGLGVRIAMDDFGTGYSSLSYLRSFPFDKIKIDRSFIHDIQFDPEALAIVRAVTSLGRSLGMSTTAEGIETEEQLAQLRADGCTEAQGFFLGRPISSDDVVAWIHQSSLRSVEAA